MRFLLFFIIFPLFSEIASPNPFSKIINSRSACGVNPVTGQFWLHEEDLIISGVQPLKFVRTEKGILQHLFLTPNDEYIDVVDESGHTIRCHKNGGPVADCLPNSNTDFSSRSDLHNLRCATTDIFITVTFPDNRIYRYVKRGHPPSPLFSADTYVLQSEQLPNGYIYHYFYKDGKISEIRVSTPTHNPSVPGSSPGCPIFLSC